MSIFSASMLAPSPLAPSPEIDLARFLGAQHRAAFALDRSEPPLSSPCSPFCSRCQMPSSASLMLSGFEPPSLDSDEVLESSALTRAFFLMDRSGPVERRSDRQAFLPCYGSTLDGTLMVCSGDPVVSDGQPLCDLCLHELLLSGDLMDLGSTLGDRARLQSLRPSTLRRRARAEILALIKAFGG